MANMSMMQPRDLVLAVIGLCGQRPEFGRTSLQKVTYLASQVLKVNLGHRAYYYGPYSSTVEADTDALVISGLISETEEWLGSNRGLPIKHFHYTVTSAGKERLDRIKSTYPDQITKLEEFIDRVISVVGSLEQYTLAAAAKTLYIAHEQNKPVSTDKIKTLARDFGWKLSTAKIDQVAEMLCQLQLAKVVDS